MRTDLPVRQEHLEILAALTACLESQSVADALEIRTRGNVEFHVNRTAQQSATRKVRNSDELVVGVDVNVEDQFPNPVRCGDEVRQRAGAGKQRTQEGHGESVAATAQVA